MPRTLYKYTVCTYVHHVACIEFISVCQSVQFVVVFVHILWKCICIRNQDPFGLYANICLQIEKKYIMKMHSVIFRIVHFKIHFNFYPNSNNRKTKLSDSFFSATFETLHLANHVHIMLSCDDFIQ